MSLTREPLHFGDKWGMILCPCYLSGVADALSHHKTIVERSLLPNIIAQLFRTWGHPQVDLFALASNATVSTFFSIDWHDRQALWIDALQQPWTVSWMYAFLPPHLILQTLAKLAGVHGILLLITPWWPDAVWVGEAVALSLCRPLRLPCPLWSSSQHET